ncbi:transcriptional regulator, AraC family [Chitinophaga pinensis DSM 2588]|uniref:Transcriptional regulator, AraC family n=2 Tax=Chitinophaga pinensis TaxID=79329 RepID=A0A979GVR6_CHIPD|nr:transcriptional regulator, AraC family [Chitinophaga pinensis DSM 2588]
MKSRSESLGQFYQHKFNAEDISTAPVYNSFNVFSIEDRILSGTSSPSFVRRDFYKIMLFRGENVFHFADKSVTVSGNTLLFFNPQVPYTYDALSTNTSGYFCVFREEFFNDAIKFPVRNNPLFMADAKPIYSLSAEHSKQVADLFIKMSEELNAEFDYKYDLIRSYVLELIFFALKLENSSQQDIRSNASFRIARVFKELLERQFPIASPSQRFTLRSPQKFADALSIHTNYLNRAVKKATGKTTTEHIFERLISEAKILLRHSDWSIAEISFALGFEDPAHFNHFFKKQTQVTPTAFRSV